MLRAVAAAQCRAAARLVSVRTMAGAAKYAKVQAARKSVRKSKPVYPVRAPGAPPIAFRQPTPQKLFLGSLAQQTLSSEIVLYLQHNNLKRSDWEELRDIGFPDVRIRMVKNTIFTKAIQSRPALAKLEGLMLGPMATVSAPGLTPAFKAVLAKMVPLRERLLVLGASYGETVLTTEELTAVTKLPPIDTLRAELVGLLQVSGARLFAGVSAPLNALNRTLTLAAKAGTETAAAAAPAAAGAAAAAPAAAAAAPPAAAAPAAAAKPAAK